jgi:hypothetical protein
MLTDFVVNCLSGLWTRFFFGFTLQLLYELSPVLGFLTVGYLVYLLARLYWHQVVLFIKTPERRWSIAQETVALLGFVFGLGLGFRIVPAA